MSNLPNHDSFYKNVGKRMGFYGQVSSIALNTGRGGYARLTVKDVCEKSSQRQFRDHVNLFISKADYELIIGNTMNTKLGDYITFSAVVSKYKRHINGSKRYCKVCYGLNNAKAFKRIEL